MKQHDGAKTLKSSTVEKQSQGKNHGDVADDRRLGITEDVGAGESSAGEDIDTAGTEPDDRTMQQRSADAADEAGSAFLPHDKVFMQDEGLRRPAPKELLDGDADPETGKHTEATMPPGEGKDPKRNTM